MIDVYKVIQLGSPSTVTSRMDGIKLPCKMYALPLHVLLYQSLIILSRPSITAITLMIPQALGIRQLAHT